MNVQSRSIFFILFGTYFFWPLNDIYHIFGIVNYYCGNLALWIYPFIASEFLVLWLIFSAFIYIYARIVKYESMFRQVHISEVSSTLLQLFISDLMFYFTPVLINFSPESIPSFFLIEYPESNGTTKSINPRLAIAMYISSSYYVLKFSAL